MRLDTFEEMIDAPHANADRWRKRLAEFGCKKTISATSEIAYNCMAAHPKRLAYVGSQKRGQVRV